MHCIMQCTTVTLISNTINFRIHCMYTFYKKSLFITYPAKKFYSLVSDVSSSREISGQTGNCDFDGLWLEFQAIITVVLIVNY